MTPSVHQSSQQHKSTWSSLCCPGCLKIFSEQHVPLNLVCGHALCYLCVQQPATSCCPLDQTEISDETKDYPINLPLLSILGIQINSSLERKSLKARFPPNSRDFSTFSTIESLLISMAEDLLYVFHSESGLDVGSKEVISGALQRKILALLTTQPILNQGRVLALKTLRAIAEKIMTEMILAIQNSSYISSNLWTAVRSRGCQFLGPAMQQDALRLILQTLSKGEMVARKTLVMSVVQSLSDDYPHVSKTCIGHVVQLLYRASCFNVIKRDGESSLMQLKEEFCNYESLRLEHDSQIIQIACEANLKISPEQWSSLLYGDLNHSRKLKNNNINKKQEMRSNSFVGQRLYKTRLCREIVQGKVCLLGDRCTYAHAIDEIRHVPTVLPHKIGVFNGQQECAPLPVIPSMPPHLLREYHRMCVPPPVQGVQTTLDPLPVMPVIIQNTATAAASAINPPLLNLSNGQVGQPAQQPLPIDPSAIIMVPQPPQPIQLVPNNPTNPIAAASIYPFSNPGAGSVVPLTDTNIFPPYIPPPAQLIQHIWNHPSTTDPLFLDPNAENIPFNGNFFFAPHYSSNSTNNCNTTSSASKQLYDEGWGDSTEEEQLLLRRNEIISRLGQILRPCSQIDENNLEDDLESHVSFTVANSVLSDPIYINGIEEQKGQEPINPIELPPLHMGHSAVGQLQMNSNTAISQTSLSMLNTMTYSMARDSAKPSLCSTIRTACPSSYSHSQESTTVQADCSIMNIKDVIDQPLVISSLQQQNLSPQATYDMVDPCNLMEQLPTTIKPLQMMPCGDPQDFVACSLDRIMEMKERISDVEKNNVLSSAVEKEQMKVELRIASRQISSLDEQTKESCLLKELKAVDEKIENLNINA